MARGPRQYFPGENEGDVYSRMVQVIRQLGFNEDLRLDVGVITKLNPMEITIVGGGGIVFEEEDFTLPERLTKHYEYHNGNRVEVDPRLKVGDCVIGISDEHDFRYMIVDRIKKSEADEWIEGESEGSNE